MLIELAQAGLLQVDGPIYRLSADLRKPDQAQLDPDAAILAHALGQGVMARREAMQLNGLTEKQVEYRLRKLVRDGQ